MYNELLNQLDSKIESLIEEVETLRLEISELREQKTQLETSAQNQSERLQQLLNKFNRLDESADL
ncbi:cell division protein ZapB [Nitrincola tapanii]|jgi:cell division protein ZapB|uniref:Cell division protein ZapB n=1 Tax=Nitrincola tapanii TaxID=1708751 RepID=A0A5A9W1P6_9GAMM|nr:cell division protein ZapB [Nitrincola tapanii]KAA0874657.1 cell division protein ZapB [Nitrincola tapanii]